MEIYEFRKGNLFLQIICRQIADERKIFFTSAATVPTKFKTVSAPKTCCPTSPGRMLFPSMMAPVAVVPAPAGFPFRNLVEFVGYAAIGLDCKLIENKSD
jgi:hypothetical protein